jgi:hypothetical protein
VINPCYQQPFGQPTSITLITLMIVSKMPFTPGTGMPSAAELSSPKIPLPTNFAVCIAGEGFDEDSIDTSVIPTLEIGAGVTETAD